MLKTIMVLSDGTEISSGNGKTTTITGCKITECVNSGEELTPGSVCSACAEITVLCTSGSFSIAVGDEFTIYKRDDYGTWHKTGIFIVEKCKITSTYTRKITAYDRASRLDMDLSGRLNSIDSHFYHPWSGGSYLSLSLSASAICQMCGLTFVDSGSIPNADFPIYQFDDSQLTGRQVMSWIGQLAGRFCRATPDGEIELAQYVNRNITIRPSGSRYYFGGSLSYEDYDVAAIDGVRYGFYLDGLYGLWELSANGETALGSSANPYTMPEENKMYVATSYETYRSTTIPTILEQLMGIGSYRPCKVSIPACMDIRAGDIVSVVTPSGKTLRVLVMTKTQNGSRDTLECTGSPRLLGSTALNNRR